MTNVLTLGVFYGYLSAQEQRSGKQLYARLDHAAINAAANGTNDQTAIRTEVNKQLAALRQAPDFNQLVVTNNAKPASWKERFGRWLTKVIVHK